MKEILFASSNDGKIEEITSMLLKINIKVLSLKDFRSVEEVKEDGLTFYDNAVIKAKYYYNQFKIPVLTDDSGLCVRCLNNAPGVRSARFAGCLDKDKKDQENIKKLLNLLKDETDLSAYFKTVLVYFDGTNIYQTSGIMEGKIVMDQKGENGFGYDPIFVPKNYYKTLAELSLNEKNHISHRKKALVKMLNILKDK